MLGLATDNSQGQWGGVVLLGRAPITDCTVAPAATPGTVDCERQTEGAVDPAYFGGATADRQQRHDGLRADPLLGLRPFGQHRTAVADAGGAGSGTTIDHFHSHNSSDDGFEIFGGRADLRHFVVTGADDDNFDVDTGYQGTHPVRDRRAEDLRHPDSMIELDSANALEDNTPRTHLKFANFTLVHRNPASGNNAAMLLRGGADATLVNGVLTQPDGVPASERHQHPHRRCAQPEGRAAGVQVGGHAVWRTARSSARAASRRSRSSDLSPRARNNSSAFTGSLTGMFINGATETAVAATDPKTFDAAFDTTTYVGAVKDAADTWYAGWTCNSATANFVRRARLARCRCSDGSRVLRRRIATDVAICRSPEEY